MIFCPRGAISYAILSDKLCKESQFSIRLATKLFDCHIFRSSLQDQTRPTNLPEFQDERFRFWLDGRRSGGRSSVGWAPSHKIKAVVWRSIQAVRRLAPQEESPGDQREVHAGLFFPRNGPSEALHQMEPLFDVKDDHQPEYRSQHRYVYELDILPKAKIGWISSQEVKNLHKRRNFPIPEGCWRRKLFSNESKSTEKHFVPVHTRQSNLFIY